MSTMSSQFRPDYAVPPGSILAERLATHGISQAECARRCGRSPKLISEIIAGKAPVEPDTALQFEKVLGVEASIWLDVETAYQLHRARETEAAAAAESAEWSRAFPVSELVRRRCFRKPESDAAAVSRLLSFFGVASVEAWTERYGLANVAYRHSPSFESNDAAVATWLRLGELQAESQECAEYNQTEFKRALHKIRSLTRMPIDEALIRTRDLSNLAGVAVILVKPLPETSLSGAARWLSPRKAVIQLSARHKTDDHLWFSFFHEAAHVLLHGKKNTFVDGPNGATTKLETEANEWASNALVPRRDWKGFAATRPRSTHAVQSFADRQGIAPGIVVGMLQHERILPWTHLNGLKVKLRWLDKDG